MHSTLTEIYRIIFDKNKTRNHEDILHETLITYNNAIHSQTKLTPFELFYGRTYKFKNISYNNVHHYLEKLNEFQEHLYSSVKEQVGKRVTKNIGKLNQNRENPKSVKEGTVIFRKENRRNKLTPRFSYQTVKKNNRVTLITLKNKKLHKSKIKRKRKFQVSSGNINNRPEDRNTGPE